MKIHRDFTRDYSFLLNTIVLTFVEFCCKLSR